MKDYQDMLKQLAKISPTNTNYAQIKALVLKAGREAYQVDCYKHDYKKVAALEAKITNDMMAHTMR